MVTIFPLLCFVVLLTVSFSQSVKRQESDERKGSQIAVQDLVCPVINTSCPVERVYYNRTIHEEHIVLNLLPDRPKESWTEWFVRIIKGSVFIVTLRILMQPLFQLFDAIWEYCMKRWGAPYLESIIIYLEALQLELQKKQETRMTLSGQHIDTQ
uniref:Uncharacterized protein n=1 Tax=Panagrellus redivivus TaxID=6233 RepID=A0A7E4WAJ7_PANRE